MANNHKDFSFKQFFTTITTKKAIWIITIVGVIVYYNALLNGFVWDDLGFIVYNTQVHVFNLVTLFGPNMFNSGPFYRPLPAVYFAALYSLFGKQAFYYHFLQIVLHIISTIVLYMLLTSLFGTQEVETNTLTETEWDKLSGSQKIKLQRKYRTIGKMTDVPQNNTNIIPLYLSLIFLVHPINVESVAYIGATQSELYFIPGILALYLVRVKHISLGRFFLINGLLFLSVLTKETGFLFLLVVVLYRLIFLDKVKKVSIYLLSGGLITATYVCIRLFIGGVGWHEIKQETAIAGLSLFERLLNIPAIFLYYIKTFLFPSQLAVWQQWVVRTVSDENFIMPLILSFAFFLGLMCIAYLLFKQNKARFKVYLFFSLWYLVGMGLIIQIVPLDMTVSDRWFYFPIVGLLGMLGVGLQTVLVTEKSIKLFVVCGVLLLVLLSARTIVRNTNYYDDMVLFTHDTKFSDNAILENNWAQEYLKANNYPEALKHQQKSVALEPFIQNLGSLANLYEIMNKKQAARELMYRILDANVADYTLNNYDSGVVNASALLLVYDTPQNTIDYTIDALRKDSQSADLWGNVAIAEYLAHNERLALLAAGQAIKNASNEQTRTLYMLISQEKQLPASAIFVRR